MRHTEIRSRPQGNLRRAVLLLGLSACMPWRMAAGSEPGLTQLRGFLAGVRSAKGTFRQTTFKNSGQAAESSSGIFAFQRPGRFRWEVQKPFEQLMVADGSQLHFFDKDLNQVTVRPLKDAVGASPAAVLFGSDDLDRTFELRDGGERGGLAWVEATPKSKDAGFERIGVGLRDGLPGAMEVRDAFGRNTLFTFGDLQRNPVLSAAQFQFTAPKGADIVRQP